MKPAHKDVVMSRLRTLRTIALVTVAAVIITAVRSSGR